MVARAIEKSDVSGMAIASDNIRVNVTLSRKENDLLKKVAKEQGRSVSNYMRFCALRDARASQK